METTLDFEQELAHSLQKNTIFNFCFTGFCSGIPLKIFQLTPAHVPVCALSESRLNITRHSQLTFSILM